MHWSMYKGERTGNVSTGGFIDGDNLHKCYHNRIEDPPYEKEMLKEMARREESEVEEKDKN